MSDILTPTIDIATDHKDDFSKLRDTIAKRLCEEMSDEHLKNEDVTLHKTGTQADYDQISLETHDNPDLKFLTSDVLKNSLEQIFVKVRGELIACMFVYEQDCTLPLGASRAKADSTKIYKIGTAWTHPKYKKKGVYGSLRKWYTKEYAHLPTYSTVSNPITQSFITKNKKILRDAFSFMDIKYLADPTLRNLIEEGKDIEKQRKFLFTANHHLSKHLQTFFDKVDPETIGQETAPLSPEQIEEKQIDLLEKLYENEWTEYIYLLERTPSKWIPVSLKENLTSLKHGLQKIYITLGATQEQKDTFKEALKKIDRSKFVVKEETHSCTIIKKRKTFANTPLSEMIRGSYQLGLIPFELKEGASLQDFMDQASPNIYETHDISKQERALLIYHIKIYLLQYGDTYPLSLQIDVILKDYQELLETNIRGR